MSWPIIGPVIAYVAFKLLAYATKVSEKFANWLILGIKVDVQKKDYDTATANLKKALADKKGDPNAIQKASDDFDQALAKLGQNDIVGDHP